MGVFAVVLAVIGTGLIGFGSWIAVEAPNDGQTGIVVFPAWFLGALLGLGALLIVVSSPDAKGMRGVVTVLAVLALASVTGCFWKLR